MLRTNSYRAIAAALAILGVSGMAMAQFLEIEPNDTKANALANGAFTMSFGQYLQGNTTGSSGTGTTSTDMWLVKTAAMAPGIYRNRLTLSTTGTEGHVGTIWGLNQVAGVVGTTDTALQTSSTTTLPTRFNQWYSFGASSQLYYGVTGAATTTADYKATLDTVQVNPQNLGIFNTGTITITTVGQSHTTDTDLLVYDSNFNAIAGYGNDDTPAGAGPSSLQSTLSRTYGVGTYYLAISNTNLASNMTSPTDDNFRTGALSDFGGVVVNSNITSGLNLSFAVSDSRGTAQYSSLKAGPYDVNFYKFQVAAVPEPASMLALGGGLLAILRRRRKNQS